MGSLLNAMTRLSFVGPRLDKYDQSSDPPQAATPSALVWDVVVSGQAERYGLRYALGLYNAMNYRYTVPVSREFLQDSIVQNGRTALLSGQVAFSTPTPPWARRVSSVAGLDEPGAANRRAAA